MTTGASAAGKTTAWLRTHIDPCYHTNALTPGETATQIAAWVRHRLDG
jgi:hypothetical protein